MIAPFHEVPGGVPGRRRLLLVSYHFPPGRAVGALRWQKMLGFAAERGWEADVVCLDPAAMAAPDLARLADLPAGTRLFGVPDVGTAFTVAAWARVRPLLHAGAKSEVDGTGAAASTPAAPKAGAAGVAREEVLHASVPFRQRIRRGIITLDWDLLWRRWARGARRVAEAVASPRHGAVISSGPPHVAHVVASKVARRVRVAHVMDMRDPWSLNERVSEPVAIPLHYKLAARDERAVMARAAIVVCNTEPAARALRALYPAQADHIITVMNGSDDEPRPDIATESRFVVTYAGAIYADRDPSLLFRAAARVVRDLALAPSDFQLEFLSAPEHPDGRTLVQVAEDAGLPSSFITVLGYRPRAEALGHLARAALLVSLPQDSDMAIPSKIFEYAGFDAWLLAFTTPASATAAALAGSGADVVHPDDLEGTVAVLRERYEAFRMGGRPRALNADGRFSRRRQAEPLLDRLETLAARAASASSARG